MKRKILISVSVLLALAAFFILGGISLRRVLLTKQNYILHVFGETAGKLAEGKAALEAFDFSRAEREFATAETSVKSVKQSLGPFLPLGLRISRALPSASLLRQALESIAIFEELTSRSHSLARQALKVEEDFPKGFFDPQVPLLSDLSHLEEEANGLLLFTKRVNEERGELWSRQFLGKFELARSLLSLEKINRGLQTLRWVLGEEGTRTVALLFQNPAEIRATGGFVSSFGVLRIENGRFTAFDFYDSAEADASTTAKIIPPRPLRKIARSWLPSDANWFLDFPTSAKKLSFFLENAKGIRADIVLAVNPSLVAQLLSLTGPITVSGYGEPLGEENFYEKALIATRQDYAAGTPKRFLQVFGAALWDRLQHLPSDTLPSFVRIVGDAFEEKELQAYTEKREVADFFHEKRWDGGLRQGDANDFLSVVHSNIGGEKSGYEMKDSFSLLTEIAADGRIVDTLKIERTHTGEAAAYSFFRARNYDYIRVFVPKGAELLGIHGGNAEPKFSQIDYESAGYAIDNDLGLLNGVKPVLVAQGKSVEAYEESGKTVFATWLITDPGKKNEIEITYRLPFATGFASPSYQIEIEKQSGIRPTFSHTIVIPEGATLIRGELETNGTFARSLTRGISFQFPSPQ